MKKELFRGVATAIVTPFNERGIDYTSFEVMLQRQIKNGVQAIVVLGTTGEPAAILKEEREQIIKFAKKTIKNDAKLIVGCGSNSSLVAIENYKQAKSLGADGALIVTPYYNKCTQNGLFEHYKAINDAGDLPIIVYNVPSRTGVNILPETMKKIADLENVCGIKEASGNISQILDIFEKCGNEIAIYSGEDSLNAIFYAMGGSGCVSVVSNVFPDLCVRIFELAEDKKYEKMFILQSKLQGVNKAIFLEVNPIPVKAGLNYLGLCKNILRLPLTKMTDANASVLYKEIDKLMGLKTWLFANLVAVALLA